MQLQYLAITYDGEIPPSISRLCNLEVLIIRRHHQIVKCSDDDAIIVYLPIEIWKLHKLRHLQCMGFDLPDPSTAANGDDREFNDSLVLEKLLTLSGVSAHSCTDGVLKRMRNLIKVGIRVNSSPGAIETFNNFGIRKYLRCLKSFKCVVVNPGLNSRVFFPYPKFGYNVRKLALSGCGFLWHNMRSICKFRKLEILKLRFNAFHGPKWEIKDDETLHLKFLLLEDLDIEQWIAGSSAFPNLRCLIIRHCYKLRNIPLDIGFVDKLELIEVNDCSPTVVISAQQIQEQRKSRNLTLRIISSWKDKRN